MLSMMKLKVYNLLYISFFNTDATYEKEKKETIDSYLSLHSQAILCSAPKKIFLMLHKYLIFV